MTAGEEIPGAFDLSAPCPFLNPVLFFPRQTDFKYRCRGGGNGDGAFCGRGKRSPFALPFAGIAYGRISQSNPAGCSNVVIGGLQIHYLEGRLETNAFDSDFRIAPIFTMFFIYDG